MKKSHFDAIDPEVVARFARKLAANAEKIEQSDGDLEYACLLRNQSVARMYYACFMKVLQIMECQGISFDHEQSHFGAWEKIAQLGFPKLSQEGKQLRIVRNECDYAPCSHAQGYLANAFYRLGILLDRLSVLYVDLDCVEEPEEADSDALDL